jgi:hypothetical protein
MRAQHILLLLQSWSILQAQAQRSTTDHFFIATLGFAAPGDYECVPDIESRPGYVYLTPASNITNPGCFNLADVFAEPGCNPNEADCQVPFSIDDSFRENFDASTNYSRVLYSFSTPFNATTVNATELTLNVYDGADCAEVDHPPYQFSGCEDSIQECTDLPFGVASFYITGSPDANRTGECLAGVVQGGRGSRTGVLLGVVMAVSMIVSVLVM